MNTFVQNLLTRTEGKTLEFKQDLSSPQPVLKTLIAFANTAGGRLVIGVTEDWAMAVDSIMLFLKKHAMRGADISGIRRKDVWSIPLDILREAVINALVHADYSQRGVPVRISFFDNRIEIENPGILLPGMTVEDMKQGVSRIRNPVIARVFRELKLVEQWGIGVPRIFQQARELGLPEPEILEIGMRLRFIVGLGTSVPVTSAGNKNQAQGGAQEPAQVEAQDQAQVGAQVDRQILTACAENPLSSAEIAAALGHRQLSGNLRKALPRLREAGLLAFTVPDHPKSRLQKYRVTDKGRQWIDEQKSLMTPRRGK